MGRVNTTIRYNNIYIIIMSSLKSHLTLDVLVMTSSSKILEQIPLKSNQNNTESMNPKIHTKRKVPLKNYFEARKCQTSLGHKY